MWLQIRRKLMAVFLTYRPEFVTYRPERHYMRGPGPKWREKHGMLGGLHMQVDGSEREISSGGKSLRQLRRSPLE